MQLSHPELGILYNTMLSEEIKDCIVDFVSQLESAGDKYLCDKLWIADRLIGGIGGYCMPSDPMKNPFPGGLRRELYRPLQYARSEIECCDVRTHARYVIQMCGIHLESACKLYLKSRKPWSRLGFRNITLGKAGQQIQALKEMDAAFVDGLFHYVKVYNRSKHEINQDDGKERLFNAMDAVVGYFAARLLGLHMLKAIGQDECFGVFEIAK